VSTSPPTVALLTLQVASRIAGPAVSRALLRGSVRGLPPPLPVEEARCSPGLPLPGAITSSSLLPLLPSGGPSGGLPWGCGPTSVRRPRRGSARGRVLGPCRALRPAGRFRPALLPEAVREGLATSAARPVQRAVRPRQRGPVEWGPPRRPALTGGAGNLHTGRTVVAAVPMQTSCHHHARRAVRRASGGLPEGSVRRVAGLAGGDLRGALSTSDGLPAGSRRHPRGFATPRGFPPDQAGMTGCSCDRWSPAALHLYPDPAHRGVTATLRLARRHRVSSRDIVGVVYAIQLAKPHRQALP
jgi:hypothetical protein